MFCLRISSIDFGFGKWWFFFYLRRVDMIFMVSLWMILSRIRFEGYIFGIKFVFLFRMNRFDMRIRLIYRWLFRVVFIWLFRLRLIRVDRMLIPNHRIENRNEE